MRRSDEQLFDVKPSLARCTVIEVDQDVPTGWTHSGTSTCWDVFGNCVVARAMAMVAIMVPDWVAVTPDTIRIFT